jgi:hypothetical protein
MVLEVRLRITTAVVLITVLLASGAWQTNCAAMCASAMPMECGRTHTAEVDMGDAHVKEEHHHHTHGVAHASNCSAMVHVESDCCSHSGTEMHGIILGRAAELRAGLHERSGVFTESIAAAKLVTTSSLSSFAPLPAATAASLSSVILRV